MANHRSRRKYSDPEVALVNMIIFYMLLIFLFFGCVFMAIYKLINKHTSLVGYTVAFFVGGSFGIICTRFYNVMKKEKNSSNCSLKYCKD